MAGSLESLFEKPQVRLELLQQVVAFVTPVPLPPLFVPLLRFDLLTSLSGHDQSWGTRCRVFPPEVVGHTARRVQTDGGVEVARVDVPGVDVYVIYSRTLPGRYWDPLEVRSSPDFRLKV